MIYLFRTSTRIISDRGTAFASRTFRTFCVMYGIKHVLNAVPTFRANGQCECYNKTIVQASATIAAGRNSCDWDMEIKRNQNALNTLHNNSINSPPPHKSVDRYDVKGTTEAQVLNEIRDKIYRLDVPNLRTKISEHITTEQQIQQERYDRIRKETKKYAVGDLTLVQINNIYRVLSDPLKKINNDKLFR